MEVKAVAKNVGVTPRKARLVVDLIRNKSVMEANAILRLTNKLACEAVIKVLNSAVACSLVLKVEATSLLKDIATSL